MYPPSEDTITLTLTEGEGAKLTEAMARLLDSDDLAPAFSVADKDELVQILDKINTEKQTRAAQRASWRIVSLSVMVSFAALGAMLAGIASVVIAILTDIAWLPGTGTLIGAIAGVIIAAITEGISEKNWHRTTVEPLITRALDVWVRHMSLATGHPCRANIMRVESRIGWLHKRLVIRYGSSDMSRAIERQLTFKEGQGCAGLAWRTKRVVIANLALPEAEGGAHWGLTPRHVTLTKHLKAVISVPIYRAINEHSIIGVLNFDSTEDAADAFEQDTNQDFATSVADSLSEVLFQLGQI